MKERPILFNGEMVRAILDGRKTQTRRVVKGLGDGFGVSSCDHSGTGWASAMADGLCTCVPVKCPYGQPGDLLWVRETWAEHHPCGIQPGRFSLPGRAGIPGPPIVKYRVIYRADGDPIRVWHCDGYPYRTVQGPQREIDAKHRDVCSEFPGWSPSIHMPRRFSRITLRITDVRVERVQEISEADAAAEGFRWLSKDGRLWKCGIPDKDGLPGNDDDGWHWSEWCADPRDAFHRLWDSINAARGYGWDANPWVWAVTFERVSP